MTSNENQEREYRLVFDGPGDPTPDTLRKIKGVFLADLEIPAEAALEILQNAPVTIKSSDSAEELEREYRLLREAGSKVLIVKKDGTPHDLLGLDELSLFEFAEGEESEPVSGAKDPVATYSLNEDSNEDLELVLKEAAAVTPEIKEGGDLPLENARTTFTLALSLEDDEAPKSPKVESTPTNAPETPKAESSAAPIALELSLDETVAAPVVEKQQPVSEKKEIKEEKNFELTLAPEDPAEVSAVKIEALKAAESAPAPLIGPELVNPEPEPIKAEAPPSPPAVEPPKAKPEAPKQLAKPAPGVPAEDSVPAEINVVAVRDRRRKKLPPGVDVGAAIVLGSIVLFVANWMYFNAPPPIDDNETVMAQEMALKVAQKKKDLQKRQRAEAEERERAAAALAHPNQYVGGADFEGTHVELTLNVVNNAPTGATLTIESAEPAPLTNEQIARGESLAPWIRRAETAPFEFIVTEDGAFSAEATTKVFIETPDNPGRIVRKSVLQGKIEGKDVETITATLSVAEKDGVELNEGMWTLSAPNGAFEFSFKKTLELQRKSAPPESEPIAAPKSENN